ncbi:unnamed protein product [Blepharisma stoltei]|uniref:Uncharacterized protein n=1 Tax=Blepharisma stoltei TaxID=1481888 RepID=A0AAU9J4H9_9CILI|nr:unnamed protein product [Blepharisma stoltei]
MASQSEPDYVFKVIIVGDSFVGKTCTLIQRSERYFKKDYSATIGLDFRATDIIIGNSKVKLQIWDTAGQERFRAFVKVYYRDSDGICIMFDKSSRESFDHVDGWIKDIDKEVENKNQIRILVGNKADLKSVVINEEANIKAEKYNMDYVEISAKENYQVDFLFEALAFRLLERGAKLQSDESLKLASREKRFYRDCC